MTTDQTQQTLSRLSVLIPLAANWWLLFLRGVISVLFGVSAFIWPGLTLLTLVILFAVYALTDGVISIAAAVRGKPELGSRWWLAVVGAASLLAGIFAFLVPGATVAAFALIIGVWSLANGIFEIIGAIRLRKEIDNEWLLIIAGLSNIIFGLIILTVPGLGLLTIIYIIGIYAVISGAALAAFAWRLRGLAK